MKARSSISLSGRSRSDSKTLPPPFGLTGLARPLDHQLVDERPLARRRAAAAGRRAARARARPSARRRRCPPRRRARRCPSFSTCAETSARSSPARNRVQRLLALRPADVAGERHDQVLARDRVGRLVVARRRPACAARGDAPSSSASASRLRRGNASMRRARRQAAIPRRPSSVRAASCRKSSHGAAQVVAPKARRASAVDGARARRTRGARRDRAPGAR